MLKKVHLLLLASCICFNESAFSLAARQPAENAPTVKASEKIELKKQHLSKDLAAKSPDLKPLADLSKAINALSEKALPAVVNISTTQVIESKDKGLDVPKFAPGSPFEELFRDFFDQMDQQRPKKVQSLGSGFVIKIDGNTAYVVTNNHVISGSKKTTILCHNKLELDGIVHASDERTDLAVIKVDLSKVPSEKHPKALEWGASENTQVGDIVVAIGNAFGLGSTLTWGVVSFKGRDLMTKRTSYVDDFIQHSAPINMGNSGGCLLNHFGQVVGVNTAIFTPSGGNVGIGFAIPSNVAKSTVEQLIEFGRTRRGWLGIQVQQMDNNMAESLGLKSQKGAIVGGVTPGGPADKAGMKHSDVILEFDGKPLNEESRIQRLVGETPIGKKVKVKVWRNKKEASLEVTIGEYTESSAEKAKTDKNKDEKEKSPSKVVDLLGLKLSEIPDEVRQKKQDAGELKGVYVLRVTPNSAAEESGLARGDIVSEVNQEPVSTPSDFVNIIAKIKKEKQRKNVLLFVSRNGDPRFITLKLDEQTEDANKKTS